MLCAGSFEPAQNALYNGTTHRSDIPAPEYIAT